MRSGHFNFKVEQAPNASYGESLPQSFLSEWDHVMNSTYGTAANLSWFCDLIIVLLLKSHRVCIYYL